MILASFTLSRFTCRKEETSKPMVSIIVLRRSHCRDTKECTMLYEVFPLIIVTAEPVVVVQFPCRGKGPLLG